MKNFQLAVFIFVLAFLPLSSVHAGENLPRPAASPLATLVLSDQQEVYDLDCSVEVLVGGGDEISFVSLASGQHPGEFHFIEDVDISGETGVWLRVQVENQANNRMRWLLVYDNYRMNEIAGYLPETNGDGFREVWTGNTYPFSSRDIDYRFYVFNMNLDPGDSEMIYIYLSDLSGIIKLSPLKIVSFDWFSEKAFVEYFWAGGYYFFIITILMVNVFFIYSIRDKSVISYVLLLVTTLFSSIAADGYGHQFIWPNITWLSEASSILSISLYLVSLLNFTIVVLDLESYYPVWANSMKAFIIGALSLTAIRYFPWIDATFLTPLIILIIVAGFVAPFLVAVRMLRYQRRASLVFLLAFGVYLILIIVGVLDTTIGDGSYSNTTLNRVAFAWVLIIFTFISNDQIVQLRKDREKARAAMLVEKEDALRMQMALTHVLEQSNEDIVDAYDTTLSGWAQLLEIRDKETEGHSRRVVELTIQLAKEFGLKEIDLEHIRRGALLHDIGKVAIPDRILLKPGPLTQDEWAVMKQHPQFAREVLGDIPYLEKAIDIPIYHHENWDGSGYPYGFKGKDIPIAARIFTIVDNWDALLSDRPYREAWPYPKVMEYLRQNSGVKFDPEILQVFFRLIEESGEYST